MCFTSFSVLNRIQDVNEAEANFNVARSHSQIFAFVHIAHAKFEQSQGRDVVGFLVQRNTFVQTCYLGYYSIFSFVLLGNTKRAVYILQDAIELGAKPKEQLEAVLRSIQTGKTQFSYSEDKENVPREFFFLFLFHLISRLHYLAVVAFKADFHILPLFLSARFSPH